MKVIKLKTDRMKVEIEGSVGWMTFNQPEKRNAVSYDMWKAIPDIINEFSMDGNVRVVVMKGAGDKAFVSGADISEFEEKRKTKDQVRIYDEATSAANIALTTLKKPLIAMIRGFCIGGGLAIALNADIRISCELGQFGVPAARLGVGYGYRGIKQLMNLVGPSYTKEIFFTGRRFSAYEALQMGLVNRVVPEDDLQNTVEEYANIIADNAPLTIKASKMAVNEGMKDPDERDLKKIDELVVQCFASKDYSEGRLAFMEKRKPKFQGR
jgi:enoyl-CoA hydratase/carnithine racemase